jgi:phage-related protein
LIFFSQRPGIEPVRDWLRALPAAERQAIGKDLLRAQWRWPVGMPLCRPLEDGLLEVRTDHPAGRTARVLICLAADILSLYIGSSKRRGQRLSVI